MGLGGGDGIEYILCSIVVKGCVRLPCGGQDTNNRLLFDCVVLADAHGKHDEDRERKSERERERIS